MVVTLGLAGVTVIWNNVLHEFFLILPFAVIALNTTDHCFKFLLGAAAVCERCHRSNREYCIEAFLECCNLHFDCFMECVMHDKVNIILCIFKNNVPLHSTLNKLNVIIARESEDKTIILNSASI